MLAENVFHELKIAVIIPTYNNCGTIADVISRVLCYTNTIIVVNDGATDGTAEILEGFRDTIDIVNHPQNQGKGRALYNGFNRALELGYAYAITIDSDGQHFPEDLPKLVAKIQSNPDSLIIGARNMSQDGIPSQSSFGNKFSNFWFWVETGIRLPDTQSGYRVYPIQKMAHLTFYCTKFEFEIEVPVRAAWSGISVISEPVQVLYYEGEERVTHFRPFMDFFRISVLNTVLCFITFGYIKPRDFFRKFTWSNIKQYLNTKDESNWNLVLSVAFGLFMGIIPIWGYQLAAAIGLAYVFKLYKPFVIIAANISIPPMLPFIIYGSIVTGTLLRGGDVSDISLANFVGLESITEHLTTYILGSISLACIVAILGGCITYLALLIFRRK